MRKEIFCPETNEAVYTYEDYLKTNHWHKKKAAYKQEHVYQCNMCDETGCLDLHHMTYERIGNEPFEDLLYLCKSCHRTIHLEINPYQTKVLKTIESKRRKGTNRIKANCQYCYHLRSNTTGGYCKLFGITKPNKKKCERYYFKQSNYNKYQKRQGKENGSQK